MKILDLLFKREDDKISFLAAQAKSVTVDKSLWKELRKIALDEEVNMTELLDEMMKDYLKKYRNSKNGKHRGRQLTDAGGSVLALDE